MDERENERVLRLEGEVKTLTEELVQCQADKEFVWSLWKRLQVASPDLTQAVSLVVEREKQKAEAKDRKVLEILQAKDFKIQELEQEATAQRMKLSSLTQQRHHGDEESGVMKEELAGLRRNVSSVARQLQELQEREEEWGCVRRDLEEARRGLEERCTGLQGALHQAQEQQEESRRREALNTNRVKELQEEVVRSRAELLEAQGQCSACSAQLLAVEQQASEKELQLQQISRELQELQGLYRQSVQHAGEQAELIQQLEGLNLDTQHVLHSQEQAHSTHTASYQQLYTELSLSYQALRCSEETLRQRDTVLSVQLHQRDQHISQLQAELQRLRERVCQAEAVSLRAPPPQPQLFEAEDQQPCGVLDQPLDQQASSPDILPQDKEAAEGREPQTHPLSSSGAAQHSQQCSRSLSPSSRGVAERRIQQLEELLSLKTEENEALRRAHAKRHDRLRLIQTNYRTVKEQLREVEHLQDERSRQRRADPWQLRQENSDAVWNELSFYKREIKKLLTEKAHLEEELDVVRVQAAVDRVTAHELRMCLEEERRELQRRDDEEEQVMKTIPLVLPSAQRLEQSVQKIEVLERKMVCLERETAQLREKNQSLQEANSLLAQDRAGLQAALKRASSREEAAQAWASAERERLLGEARALEAQVQSSRREAGEALAGEANAKRTVLKLRQELGVLRAERDFHRALSRRRGKAQRLPATRPSQTQAHSHHCRGHSPAKDEWEDIGADSETEDFSDSLESRPPARTRRSSFKPKGCRHALIAPRDVRRPTAALRAPPLRSPASLGPVRQDLRKRRTTKGQHSCARLLQRLACLQQQVAVLQSASRAAQEQRAKHSQVQMELESLMHKLQASNQLSQKQACELVKLQQQVTMLEAELEQWRKPHPPIREQPPVAPPLADSNHPTLKLLEDNIKQLTSKLKSSNVEGNRLNAVIQELRTELHDRDRRLKELQDKLSHNERDVVMKRQLVEDLRNRLKVLQDSERSHRSLTDDLEKKVKSLSEEAANRKTFIESLKRRLSVATEEKNQHESTSKKLKEDLQKRDEKLAALQARLGECEKSRLEVEQTACAQVRVLTQQNSDALQTLKTKLNLVQVQEQQLRSLTQALAVEVARDVRDTREQLRRKKREKRKDGAVSGVSEKSMVKAKSIAASILNLTEVDLASVLNTDEEEECDEEADRDWMNQVQQILLQQVPSAGVLLEVLLMKMKEWRVLTEELAAFSPTVSKNT